MILEAHGLPPGEAEYQFAPPRRWRLDWAWPGKLVALEIEGGHMTGGRHTRWRGFEQDISKYNRATELGWSVYRCTRKQFNDCGPIFDLLRAVLGGQEVLHQWEWEDGRWYVGPGRPHAELVGQDQQRNPRVIGRHLLRCEAEQIAAAHNDALENQQARLARIHQAKMAATAARRVFSATR